MYSGELKGVFGETLNRSRQLINDQIKAIQQEKEGGKKPKAIILVGGFGACRYVYDTLKVEHSKNKIEILQPRGDDP
jgi:hypothetical protein